MANNDFRLKVGLEEKIINLLLKRKESMAEINDIYKCNICGNILESVHGGSDSLTCCGTKMTKLEPVSGPEGLEKHLPVIEKSGNIITVKVGTVPHPMLEEHLIEWIEVICGARINRIFLHPGEEARAEFELDKDQEQIIARAYCNVHGLWSSNLS